MTIGYFPILRIKFCWMIDTVMLLMKQWRVVVGQNCGDLNLWPFDYHILFWALNHLGYKIHMVIDIISYYRINNCGGLNLCPLDLYIMYWAWALYQLGYSYFILLNRSFQGFCLDFIVISNALISCCITHRQTECLNLLSVFISCVTHRQTESLTTL